ncbi:MAG TPA: cyclase family protein [Acholeplasmataceae bacterium]|nr:cyclase family protein [Acholeplasmataceae bacterium]
MKIYDISMAINENMIVYKNKEEKKPKIINRANHNTSTYHESSIVLDLHTGTHIDAPLHMIKDGNMINDYSLSSFITPCYVIDFTNLEDKISEKDLKLKNIKVNDFVLLKTKNSFNESFDFNFVYLDEEGARYLKSLNIKGVGIDALGIERNQENHPTHKILLSNNIIIIEGLKLDNVPEGKYQLIALPLKIDGVEASPTRAILIEK